VKQLQKPLTEFSMAFLVLIVNPKLIGWTNVDLFSLMLAFIEVAG